MLQINIRGACYNIVNEVIDPNGRYIYFELVLGDRTYKLINIYAPNNNYERVKFFCELDKWIDFDNETMVGGDFNCTLDSAMDRKNCTHSLDIGQIDLKKIMTEKCLQDIWRRRFPQNQIFSWSRGEKSSRIDFWLISESLDSQVDKIEYLPCIYSGFPHST